MFYIKQFIYAFLSTVGFSILFSIPRDSILKSGVCGALGWLVYVEINNSFSSPVAGAFLGAITVSMIGEFFARYFRKPATVFIIPGIIPLVPGAGMYYTMLAIIEKDFFKSAQIGSETIFVAGSIASGIIISSSLSKLFKVQKRKTAK